MKSKGISGFVLAIFFFLCLIGHGLDVHALTLEELIGHEQTKALLAGEKPVSTQFKDPRPRLLPQHEVLSSLVDTIRRDLNPSVMVETVNVYKKPANAGKGHWSAGEEAKLYNGALALSTMAGLQYYSATRDSMRTFYETSSVIDGPSTKKPLPDPVYSRPISELRIHARQKDLSFGDNIYQYDYYSAQGIMIFVQQNLTSLNYGIIPAVGKNNLRSVFAVLDAGDHLLVYMVSMSKAASLPGMKERIGNSFYNRTEAIFLWFSAQADRAFT